MTTIHIVSNVAIKLVEKCSLQYLKLIRIISDHGRRNVLKKIYQVCLLWFKIVGDFGKGNRIV
jgi:hypothetical protein